jgi:dihydroflavonol-4-reductase
MKTVSLFGATGFIGGHIALAALEQGWEVRGLRRRPGAVGHIDGAPVRWFEGNLDRPDSLEDVLRGSDLLFHSAAYYPQGSRPVPEHVAYSVQQIRSVLEAAKAAGVGRVVYTSSMSTIGRPPAGAKRLADERDRYSPGSLPGSAYYECKCAMESQALRSCSTDLEVVVTNPTLVLGPGDVHRAVGRVVIPLARGWGLVWLPGTVNAIDVRDVARAHIRAAVSGRPGERYILGGHNLSIRSLQNLIADQAGVSRPRLGVPERWIEGLGAALEHVPGMRLYGNHLHALSHWQGYDTRKAEAQLGLHARPIEITIGEMIAWYRGSGYM